MKIVQINTTCGIGSTGKICVSIGELLDKNGTDNYILYSGSGKEQKNAIQIAGRNYIKLQAAKARIFGNWGFNSKIATKKIIRCLKEIQPDIVHLHNIHSHDCNLSLLFKYFKKTKQELFWTFHDCWAFTGYCTHFIFEKCDKWKTSCQNCPQRKRYSAFFDRSKVLFKKKRELFKGLDLTIVTPSDWLANLVKQSFFKEYPIKVIHNGIDLNVFKPTPSAFREKYGIEKDTYIILGVAFGWGKKKGLDVFVELSKRLDNRFQIVLVGTDEKTDSKLPANIISIHRTQNQRELAEIYTAADVFVNPTKEEVLGLVNIEALACGTPVITFDTGGCPECISKECGMTIPCDDVDALYHAIVHSFKNRHFGESVCRERAKSFDLAEKFGEYVDAYFKAI